MESTLSDKKQSKLYHDVYEEIMQARIKIAKLLNDLPEVGKEVDNVLSKLSFDAPEKAIAVFFKRKK